MKIYLLLACLVLSVWYVSAQEKVTGRVFDATTKKAVENAVIKVEGNAKKIVSGKNGQFVLELPKGRHVVKISMVGYVPKELVIQDPFNSELTILISPDETQLDDVTVVSTGYQNIPKERATGSFSLIDNKTFNQQITTSVLERLEGITPALTVDRRTNSPGIMIRGLSTLQGDRSPLIVLDNYPYEGNINNINPNDIDNITILKDAAASSIWGVKAGNGVIVINTKKAKFNQPLSISVSASQITSGKPDLNYLRPISTNDFIDVEQMLFSKGYYTSLENSFDKAPLTPLVELLIANRDGKVSSQELHSQIELLRLNNISDNYSNSFFGNAINRQYSIELKAGGEKQNWRIFSGFDNNHDALSAIYRRFNVKVDNSFKVGTKLEFSTSLLVNISNSKSGKTDFSSLNASNGALPPYTSFVSATGNPLPVMRDYRASSILSLGNANLLDWNYYPLTNGEEERTTSDVFDFLGNLRASYSVLPGLRLTANYQFERQNTQGGTRASQNSYSVRNIINQFSQINAGNITRPIPLGEIWNENINDLNVNNIRGQINYDKTFDSFSISAIAGSEMRQSTTDSHSGRSYGVNGNTLQTSTVDYLNFYKNILTGANMIIPNIDSYGRLVNRYVSFFGNAAVGFRERYTISGSLRRDASNLFGVSTNNKWNPLWSVGLSWDASKEEWFPKALIPYMKLRATYGVSGNANSRLAAVTTITFSGTNPYTQSPYAGFSNYANPDLRWERVRTLNLGTDIKFLGERISASLDYYVKKSDDLIGTESIDITAGIGSRVTRNTAAITVKGLDIELSALNTVGKLRWQTNFFVNFYKDRVDKYYLNNDYGYNYVNGNSNVSGIIGQPAYSVLSYKWAGLNPKNGNPMGFVNDAISEDYQTITGTKSMITDLAYSGPAFPTSSLSLGNTFSYHNFDLDFRITGKFGFYFRRPSISYTDLFSTRNGNADFAQRWQKPGDELYTNVPSLVYPANSNRDAFYNFSEATVLSGDHVRFQYLSFGYNFLKENFSFLPFRSISLRAVASNLGLLYNSNGYGLDPDFPISKPLKTYSFNLKINL
ncbi:SusC/RagA family TonB-linked outer membrane protein [Pedobacter sp. MR22-3]|uniref:SusC/RagA family TonB-linked outer membrane protein n=1 Tax=Pedobacter sp. MR22-3 TaxID=2994552 RepID=UPI00224789EF|nr:SusC/RagA family TonB-linked outer membrane protein [Pedobacter sp. MR22-3]MCX2584337.1 SusC/RagA family TonB-linked outer membrane protein [Pedobacter sp. MR22-3]